MIKTYKYVGILILCLLLHSCFTDHRIYFDEENEIISTGNNILYISIDYYTVIKKDTVFTYGATWRPKKGLKVNQFEIRKWQLFFDEEGNKQGDIIDFNKNSILVLSNEAYDRPSHEICLLINQNTIVQHPDPRSFINNNL